MSQADWRLKGAHDDWLRGATFFWRSFRPRRAVMWSPESGQSVESDWDHEHCYFCWAKFSHAEGDLSAGWTTDSRTAAAAGVKDGRRIASAIDPRVQEPVERGYEWLCPKCFEDFRERFAWTVEGEHPPASTGTDS